ncbi:restriction endonuclease [Gracilibacillus lacisalsi]|uniref:restriction endonuclease n=1 Tax=Gracilibacillus lacisalsi TaxID=393087 RepID=UPI000362A3D1|nr:restriction endonuclease [Gracilibacillus lacisalsi]
MTAKQRDSILHLIRIILIISGLAIWYINRFELHFIFFFAALIVPWIITAILSWIIPVKRTKRKPKKKVTNKKTATNKTVSKKISTKDKNYLLKADFQSLTGEEFEQLCIMYFEDKGYKPQHIGRAGDHGVDIIVRDPKDGLQMAVQCKRYKVGNNVSNADLIKLEGGKRFYKTPGTFFITTSNYTRSAKEFGQETGMKMWHGLHVEQFIGEWRKQKLKKIS